MNPTRVPRRTIIAIPLLGVSSIPAEAAPSQTLLEATLTQFFVHRDSVLRLGRALSSLSGTCPGVGELWACLSGVSSCSELARLIQDDYRSGRTVTVAGWLLSQSELCAILLFCGMQDADPPREAGRA